MSALSPWVFEKCQPLARCDGELGQGVGAIIGRQERVGASPVKAVMSMIYIYIYMHNESACAAMLSGLCTSYGFCPGYQ
jgi:hypothetical protein